ncbi:hypothetical protein SCOCK_20314 [Actinacidiphila cocklensis]|uniref:Uncharacterized protein n=1 Tax=Actinacidiphila cocklensis TaxID=887465 RepID=A0A9W4GS60_9ACTN|nr:hypothetical protein SCOCK_20314 [Actinacidiphila cocklensis]
MFSRLVATSPAIRVRIRWETRARRVGAEVAESLGMGTLSRPDALTGDVPRIDAEA